MRKWKRSGSCSCDSEFLRDKVLAKQDPKDCKTLKCSGYDPANETPDDKTGKGDCRTTKCVNGSAQSEADDSDKPDPAASDDNKCKTCKDGDIVPDKSKNQNKCSAKEGQECFVCVDGSCKRPDCKASGATKKTTLTIGSFPIFKTVSDTLRKVSERSHQINLSLEKVRGEYILEFGEKCCGCEERGMEPTSYAKNTGWIGAEIAATVAPMGVALTTPPKHVGGGIYIYGVLEVGTLIIDVNATVSGSATWEKSECEKNKSCSEVSTGFSGSLSAGPKIKYAGMVEACEAPREECANLFTMSSEVKVGVVSQLSGTVRTYLGDSCQEGCGNITIGKGQGEARFSVDVKVFDRFRYTYKVEKTIDFWDGIQRGTCQ